ncbi:MAG TPA: FadR family transcriptional regulator [Firmicutes bacterium]|nr:FadR family transcriptional regulator [Bacillota bacterium]
MSLKPITRRHATYQEIIDRIRNYIIESELKPGDRLPSEPVMAKTLQVNRSTLREALRALQLLGVIDVKHGHGTFVRAFNLDAVWSNLNYNMLLDATELREVLVVRTRLEAAFIAEVAEQVTKEQIAELYGIINRMRTRASLDEQIINEDEAFHIALFAQVENTFLKRLLAIFWQTVKQMKQHVELVNATDLPSAIHRHVLLVESLERGDVAALQHYTLHHSDGFLERVNRAVDNYRQMLGD